MFRTLSILFLLSIIGMNGLLGQVEDIEVQEDLIENIIENIETNEEFDFNTLYETLSLFKDNPIDLNKASEEDLKELQLLNDIQIGDLKNYILNNGDLISLLELQAISSFDLKTIRQIKPFITVNESTRDYHTSLGKILTSGKATLYTKWRRVWQNQEGYKLDTNFVDGREVIEAPYEGDPNRYYARLLYTYENRFKAGFTMEKDPGEAFFEGSNKYGFDFYSFHAHLRNYNQHIKDLVIGDYTIALGQGLILHNGFGGSKSSYVMNIKKGGRNIKSYNSINENNFFRGGALALQHGKYFDSVLFGSYTKIDGNVLPIDTLSSDPEESFSSFQNTGYHRTKNEIEDEKKIGRMTFGGKVRFKKRNFSLSANVLHERFDQSLNKELSLYNQYSFVGSSLTNASLDYNYRYKNINFFGETAASDNKGLAFLHGVLVGLDRKVDLSILHRHYQREYQSLNSNAFGETSGANNETGLYVGLSIRPHPGWILKMYGDIFKHDWLRFRTDAPANGREYLLRLDYFKKRRYSFYLQYRYEQKHRNTSGSQSPIDALGTTTQHRLRFNVSNKLTKSLELRNRAEFSWFDRDGDKSKGYIIYQDLLFRPNGSPFSMTARYSFFDISNYDSRIYAYENDLIYEFYIPFFIGTGKRYYINLRYNWRKVTAEFRISETLFDVPKEGSFIIGSSGEIIQGNRRTELKAQIKYNF